LLARGVERGDEAGGGVARAGVPAPGLVFVAVRIGELLGPETPAQPPPLHVGQVLEQLGRSPAGRQAARPEFRIRQAVDLADDDRPVVVEEAQQQFFRVAELSSRPGLCTTVLTLVSSRA
jgi:hypothetical protein